MYYKLYYKIIYFNISKLNLYVFITEMAEYTGKQQQEEDMDIQNISIKELISLQDENIHDFITELFNENNTLPNCELDQWLEDYLEEMEVQQKEREQKEQSQQLSDENNTSLLNMCQYSDISSVENENSPSSGQCKENKDENYDEQDDHGDHFYNSCSCIFCSRTTIHGEQGGNIGTEPVTIQYGGGLPPMYADEQPQQHDYEKRRRRRRSFRR